MISLLTDIPVWVFLESGTFAQFCEVFFLCPKHFCSSMSCLDVLLFSLLFLENRYQRSDKGKEMRIVGLMEKIMYNKEGYRILGIV